MTTCVDLWLVRRMKQIQLIYEDNVNSFNFSLWHFYHYVLIVPNKYAQYKNAQQKTNINNNKCFYESRNNNKINNKMWHRRKRVKTIYFWLNEMNLCIVNKMIEYLPEPASTSKLKSFNRERMREKEDEKNGRK